MKGRAIRGMLGALDHAAAALRLRPRTSEHLVTGQKGEEDAYFYLREHGYTVVARNWRTRRRRGELDLVAWEGATLCFVEVKTRTTREVKPAEAAVDHAKMRELSGMAREFCRRLPQSAAPAVRFDIVSVYRDTPAAPPEIALFKNAFAMP